MTQEQKAKAYDKALEIARNIHRNYKGNTWVVECMENMFPKLAESEDDKIRKALIKYFTSSDDDADYQCCGVHCKDIVAWLKNQGEKKSVDDLTQQEAMDIAVDKCFEQGK